MNKIKAALAWLRGNVWLGREAGADSFGWFNAVYLRVGSWGIHVGIERDTV